MIKDIDEEILIEALARLDKGEALEDVFASEDELRPHLEEFVILTKELEGIGELLPKPSSATLRRVIETVPAGLGDGDTRFFYGLPSSFRVLLPALMVVLLVFYGGDIRTATNPPLSSFDSVVQPIAQDLLDAPAASMEAAPDLGFSYRNLAPPPAANPAAYSYQLAALSEDGNNLETLISEVIGAYVDLDSGIQDRELAVEKLRSYLEGLDDVDSGILEEFLLRIDTALRERLENGSGYQEHFLEALQSAEDYFWENHL